MTNQDRARLLDEALCFVDEDILASAMPAGKTGAPTVFRVPRDGRVAVAAMLTAVVVALALAVVAGMPSIVTAVRWFAGLPGGTVEVSETEAESEPETESESVAESEHEHQFSSWAKGEQTKQHERHCLIDGCSEQEWGEHEWTLLLNEDLFNSLLGEGNNTSVYLCSICQETKVFNKLPITHPQLLQTIGLERIEVFGVQGVYGIFEPEQVLSIVEQVKNASYNESCSYNSPDINTISCGHISLEINTEICVTTHMVIYYTNGTSVSIDISGNCISIYKNGERCWYSMSEADMKALEELLPHN